METRGRQWLIINLNWYETMRLALGFNPILGALEAGKIAANAEALGYDSMWMHESLFQNG